MDSRRYPALTRVLARFTFQDLPDSARVAQLLDVLDDQGLENQGEVVRLLNQAGLGLAASKLQAMPPKEFGDVIFQYTLLDETPGPSA